MKKKIVLCIIFLFIILLIPAIVVVVKSSTNEIKYKYKLLESLLIPTTDEGKINFDAMEIEDYQHVAYCLKAEARLGKNTEFIRELTQYLVDHSDDNMDGEIGWGLNYAWSGYFAKNPARHVYAIQVANVIDAYIEALNSGKLSDELSAAVKKQLHDVVLLWNQKYWSENGVYGEKSFYWYSISKDDAVGCINIDAKMVGSQSKLLDQFGELFTEQEKKFIYDHIDRDYIKIIQTSFWEHGDLVWNYLEKKDAYPNDAIHHAFILEGIYDYQKFRLKEQPLSNKNYTSFLYKCIEDNIIYSNPEHSKNSCFNAGAIRWVSDQEEQQKILIKSYDLYYNSNTKKRQLAFLLDAFSIYLSSIM